MLKTILIAFLLFANAAIAQVKESSVSFTPDNEKQWEHWMKNLYDVGIGINKDTLRVNEEARKVFVDTNYKKLMYPAQYTWQSTVTLLKGLEIKKACWYLINLYATDTVNQRLVMQTLLPLDKVLQMDKVLINSFYTYGMFDPTVCVVKNGSPEISNPAMLEQKFVVVKQMIEKVMSERNKM